MPDPTPPPPSDLSRGQWWQLASGRTVQVCRVFFSEEDGAYVANVRHLDENNVMAHGSFEVLAALLIRTAKNIR